MSPLAEQVQRLALAVTLGRIDLAMFLSLVLPLLATMRARTAVDAERRLCQQLKTKPFGLYLPDESEHYEASLRTVLTDDLVVKIGEGDRLTALVDAIEQDSRQSATQKAMTIHHVSRYRLKASADACDKCRTDDGKTFPVNENPSHHNNCRCEAIPLGES